MTHLMSLAQYTWSSYVIRITKGFAQRLRYVQFLIQYISWYNHVASCIQFQLCIVLVFNGQGNCLAETDVLS